ncbi:MAG: glycosyltransferase [Burkholderiaceae bacterium]
MFNVLVRGWRGINHSIALVNQYHLLAFARRPDVTIFHEDMPFASPSWNPARNSAGFDEAQQSQINAIPAPGDEDMDAILSISVPFLPTARKCLKQVTFIVTEFGLQEAEFATGGVPARWYEEDNRMIVTPSNWCKQKLEDFGFRSERVEVIPHGVDQSVFFPITDEEREMSRRQLGFNEDEFVFLNLGGMMANKGVDLVLVAFALVLKKYPNARLLLKDMRHLYGYSTDHLFAAVNQKHSGLLTESVLAAIRVVGLSLPVNLMRAVYGAADAYVSPYRAEGFNLPVLEAMACGLTTLVTKGGPTDDFCTSVSSRFVESRHSREPISGQTVPGEYLEPSLHSLVALMESELCSGRQAIESRRKIALCVPLENQWATIAERYVGSLRSNLVPLEKLAKVNCNGNLEDSLLYCFCEGGLGNRLNSLYTSIVLAKHLGRKLKVFWPINTWCEAPFETLFEDCSLEVEAVEMIDCASLIARSARIVWEDHLRLGLSYRTPQSYSNLDEFLRDMKSEPASIFYCSPLIPQWVGNDLLDGAVFRIRPRPTYFGKADEFIANAFLGLPYAGLHIRKTDYGKLVDENLSLQLAIDNPNVMFFVCSDSEGVEAAASQLKNIRVRPKVSYVEKRIQGDWNDSIIDESGRIYPFNVRRSALSVEEAVVDLLILSKSKIIKNSSSTFLALAEIWSNFARG